MSPEDSAAALGLVKLLEECGQIEPDELDGLPNGNKKRILQLAPATCSRPQMPPGYLPAPDEGPTPPGCSPCRDPRLPTPGSTLVRRYKGDDATHIV